MDTSLTLTFRRGASGAGTLTHSFVQVKKLFLGIVKRTFPANALNYWDIPGNVHAQEKRQRVKTRGEIPARSRNCGNIHDFVKQFTNRRERWNDRLTGSQATKGIVAGSSRGLEQRIKRLGKENLVLSTRSRLRGNA
jgi:hypothetical protein